MRLTTALSALLALGAAACSGGEVKAPDSVGGLEKAQVEAIVKEYLLREPEILFEMQTAFQRNQLATQTLAAEGAWEKLLATSKDDPYIGRKDAPITIVEFSDYDCGVCKAAVPWVMAQVDDRRSDIKVIVKESAVRGEDSRRAAIAAMAAHQQGKYRDMHVALMKAPANAYTPANLEMIAQSVGLDIARWKKDMADANLIKRVDRSVEEFDMAGLQGTPSFLINGRFVGGFGQEELESLIEATRQQIRS
ncbi:MAG: thioredoxin domain-containing protein [Hyphomonadaceae bacterium]|jgi:protein-disulfide isomerase|nr:thioredoxin domain-containing protein [Hyphomonadaceae bacterium]